MYFYCGETDFPQIIMKLPKFCGLDQDIKNSNCVKNIIFCKKVKLSNKCVSNEQKNLNVTKLSLYLYIHSMRNFLEPYKDH